MFYSLEECFKKGENFKENRGADLIHGIEWNGKALNMNVMSLNRE